MASSTKPLAPGAPVRFGTLAFVCARSEESLVRTTFPRLAQAGTDSGSARSGRDPTPVPPSPIRSAADRFFNAISAQLSYLLGSEPSQKHFRDVTFSLANVVLQLAGKEPLSWSEFMASYA